MNVIEYLEEEIGIETSVKGNNIGTGWIGIQCPFCNDESNHFGIRLADLRCACWKCGSHSFTSLIIELTDCSQAKARQLQKEMVAGSPVDNDLSTRTNPPNDSDYYYYTRSSTILPPESTKVLPDLHKDYLRRRNFHPHRISRKYDLQAVHSTGRYKFRLIIPIYQTRRLVSFTTRAIFDEMTPKYLNPTIREVELSPKQVVYNIDNLITGHDAIILEGVTDVWRFGNGAIATNGVHYTQRQLLLIIEKKIRNAYVMFDNEEKAQIRGEEVCRLIYPFCESVEQISPEIHNDLGEFSPNQIHELKKMLKFK